MPLVFVHGVATRQTPEYKAWVHQRDALFQQLVLPQGAEIFDPDWGSNAVKFNAALPWLPTPGHEALGAGGVAAGNAGVGKLASRNPEVAIDLAFEAGLAARAKAAAAAGEPARSITDEQIAAFEAAVRYLEQGADKDAFNPEGTDADFLRDLADELKPHAIEKKPGGEPMGLAGDALQWLSDGVKNLVGSVANVASDAVLRVVRRPLSEQVALFLGDIFVYLRWRETDDASGTVQRIFAPIVDDIAKAAKLRSEQDPLIIVGHSLGGVILYDLLSDPDVVAGMEQKLGGKLIVDAWITVGSQPALFADMGLYGKAPPAGGLYPRPAPAKAWLNVYDFTDVLSFSCEPIFSDVKDYEFDNVTGVFSAHSAYFQRPSFYSRLRRRLKALN